MAFVKCRRRGEGGAVRILVFFLYISCEGIRVWSTQSASFCLHSCAVVRKCVQSIFWKVSGLLLLRDCMTGFKWAKVWRFFSSHFQTFLCACYVHVTVINLWHYHSCFSLCSFFLDWPLASVYCCIFQGLFARKRMLLLTEGPHLYYVDYSTKEKVVKGQIPWSVCCQWKYVC